MSMIRIRMTLGASFLALSTMALAEPPKATDQQQVTTETSRTDGSRSSKPTTDSAGNMDSREIREELMNVLRDYPPELGMVLKLDPTLFNSPQYLATYPALASFAVAHPEVGHNARYYLENVSIQGETQPDSQSFRLWRSVQSDFIAVFMFLVVTATLAWLIRTLIEQKRWSRLSRMQTETHGKLLERFTSNEDLLAYIQSPAGKRFLESAPIPLEAGPRALSAPIGRVLWSVQVGLVLMTTGIGLRYVSGRVPTDASQPLFAIGIVILAIGIGFVLSAVVSLAFSRWLGLWTQPSQLATGPFDAHETDKG